MGRLPYGTKEADDPGGDGIASRTRFTEEWDRDRAMTDAILSFLVFIRDAVVAVMMAWVGVSVAENAGHKQAPSASPAVTVQVIKGDAPNCPEGGGGGSPRIQATATGVSRAEP
jgi:hypothetical protein